MSERNRSKDCISKDETALRDTRKNNVSKETGKKTGKAQAGNNVKNSGAGKPAGATKSTREPSGQAGRSAKAAGKPPGRTGSPDRREARREQLPGTAKPGMAQRIGMLLWILLCGVLLLRVWDLNQSIGTLRDRLDKLTRLAVEQRDRLEQYAKQVRGDGQTLQSEGAGSAPASGGKPDSSGEANNGGRTEAGGDGDSQESGVAPEAAAVSGQGVAHKVYLTFDDGPSEKTEEILDILEKYNVKATFFVVGREGEEAEEALRKIVEAGHTLGMHSYTHKYDEIYDSVESFAADFQKEQDYLYEVTGVKSMVYRFPGGSSNTVSTRDMREFARYLDDIGVCFFDWNISSGDGGGFLVPVETLVENCTATIKDHSTSVVLMHDVDWKTTTREALPVIIETIQAMDDTVLLPITEDTALIQHIQWQDEKKEDDTVRKQERMW